MDYSLFNSQKKNQCAVSSVYGNLPEIYFCPILLKIGKNLQIQQTNEPALNVCGFLLSVWFALTSY